MSTRTCCYKDCENKSIQFVHNGSYTLFKFPKDQVRRELWMELGQVNPHIPPNDLFMCSDHFDSSKYISSNQRRNMLLRTAVPFPYVSRGRGRVEVADSIVDAGVSTQLIAKTVTVDCAEQENATYMYFDEVEVATLPDHKDVVEEFPVESTIEDDDDERNLIAYRALNIETAEQSSSEQEIESAYECASSPSYRVIEKHALTLNKKRRMETVSDSKKSVIKQKEMKSGPSAVKVLNLGQHKLECNQEQELSLPDGNSDVNSGYDETVLIDPQHVTTFIFKGEEYVQMPKEYFVQDKVVMLKKLERYEDALKSIKQKLNKLDIS